MFTGREEMWDATRGCKQLGGWHKHPTAHVHSTAIVFPGAVIGPGVDIHAHCVIGANAVIGGPGFGYTTLPDGSHRYRPHKFAVTVHENVHIGANSCVDAGRHRTTVIGSGTRIDNLVHIGHNCLVGRDALIIANAMLGGSCEIGDRVQISPGAQIMDHIKIGQGAHVGLGAVVIRDVGAGQVVVGNPARVIRERGVE